MLIKSLQKILLCSLVLWIGAPLVWADTPGRFVAINADMDQYEASVAERSAPSVARVDPVKEPVAAAVVPSKANNVKISGLVRLSAGVNTDGDLLFARANGDMSGERNWRMNSHAGLNNYEDTYDAEIYSRLKLIMDAPIIDPVSMHMNLTVDPWSYTGKSRAVTTATSAWGDQAAVQYLSFGSSTYTVGRNIITKKLGDVLLVPETKIDGNVVPAQNVSTTWGDVLSVPQTKMEYSFNPLRELWFDVKPGDKGYIRIFPIGYQDQALTSDDPLHLSDGRINWEESPWLWDWAPGNVNTGNTPVDFTKGSWDRSLSWLAHDSEYTRLVELRGVAIDLKPTEGGSFKAVVASPKTPWQNYGDVTAIPGSVRWKQEFAERVSVGLTGNMHLGIVDNKRIDKSNYVESADMAAILVQGVKVSGQISTSTSANDQTNATYRTNSHGNAYYASLEWNSSPEEQLNKSYIVQQAPKGVKNFEKSRLFFARMDQGFESSLSDYHATRDDSYWSQHLTFYPSPYKKLPGTAPAVTEDDLEPFAIGNGIDYGRSVVGWRGDVALWDGKVKGLADTRYITDNNGDRIESVARTQWSCELTDQWLAKALVLNRNIPGTMAGYDPYITFGDTGAFMTNPAVSKGKDADLNTGSLGSRYQLTDWAAINGVWEYTNDSVTGAIENFPRAPLNSPSSIGFGENGLWYRESLPYLYSQQYFPQPPYQYFNIFKTGLELKPSDIWTVYIDYTRNPNKFAGNVDDNVNHVGIETSVVPDDKWGFFARYTFERWYDLNTLASSGKLEYQRYNNFFFETRYCRNKDSRLSLQYGVGPVYNVGQNVNPNLAFYAAPVMATEHIIRATYEQRF
ncbi:MAG: hypothetical protein HQL18_03905 [Candidatus Omnitrophica bacterium]|nr:hypothetical protein [Candidatus Omnitrophota bacterium]